MSENDKKYGILTAIHKTVMTGEKYRPHPVYDWGYEDYNDIATRILAGERLQKYIPDIPYEFESGDLVKIFKTVSDGDVAWQGKIDLEVSDRDYIGTQKGMDVIKWHRMFHDELPAKLIKNGKEIFGHTYLHIEQGIDPFLAVQEYGVEGYDGLHKLEKDYDLTVYSTVRDGEVEWEGHVEFGLFDPKEIAYRTWFKPEIARQVQHMDAKDWMSLFFQRRPVVITPALKVEK